MAENHSSTINDTSKKQNQQTIHLQSSSLGMDNMVNAAGLYTSLSSRPQWSMRQACIQASEAGHNTSITVPSFSMPLLEFAGISGGLLQLVSMPANLTPCACCAMPCASSRHRTTASHPLHMACHAQGDTTIPFSSIPDRNAARVSCLLRLQGTDLPLQDREEEKNLAP